MHIFLQAWEELFHQSVIAWKTHSYKYALSTLRLTTVVINKTACFLFLPFQRAKDVFSVALWSSFLITRSNELCLRFARKHCEVADEPDCYREKMAAAGGTLLIKAETTFRLRSTITSINLLFLFRNESMSPLISPRVPPNRPPNVSCTTNE